MYASKVVECLDAAFGRGLHRRSGRTRRRSAETRDFDACATTRISELSSSVIFFSEDRAKMRTKGDYRLTWRHWSWDRTFYEVISVLGPRERCVWPAGGGQSVFDTVGAPVRLRLRVCVLNNLVQPVCVSRCVLAGTLAEWHPTWLFVPMPWRQRNRVAAAEQWTRKQLRL